MPTFVVVHNITRLQAKQEVDKMTIKRLLKSSPSLKLFKDKYVQKTFGVEHKGFFWFPFFPTYLHLCWV